MFVSIDIAVIEFNKRIFPVEKTTGFHQLYCGKTGLAARPWRSVRLWVALPMFQRLLGFGIVWCFKGSVEQILVALPMLQSVVLVVVQKFWVPFERNSVEFSCLILTWLRWILWQFPEGTLWPSINGNWSTSRILGYPDRVPYGLRQPHRVWKSVMTSLLRKLTMTLFQ